MCVPIADVSAQWVSLDGRTHPNHIHADPLNNIVSIPRSGPCGGFHQIVIGKEVGRPNEGKIWSGQEVARILYSKNFRWCGVFCYIYLVWKDHEKVLRR